MICARDETTSVGKIDSIGHLDGCPDIPDMSPYILPILSIERRAVDLVANLHVLELARSSIAQQNPGLAPEAVRAGGLAASVGIRAPVEVEVGRIVVREDRSRLIFEQGD